MFQMYALLKYEYFYGKTTGSVLKYKSEIK